MNASPTPPVVPAGEAVVPRKKPRRSLRYRLDKLSVYAPLITMAALALATYWLSSSMPTPDVYDRPVLKTREPDYRLHGFAVRSYRPDGRPTVEIFGEHAEHYPVDDLLQVQSPRMRALTEDGRTLTASAQIGTSDGDGTHMSLQGQAIVVQQATEKTARMEFRSEELHVWPEEERVRSDQPVELLRGQDRLSGQNLRYDKKEQAAEIGGRVRGVLYPVER